MQLQSHHPDESNNLLSLYITHHIMIKEQTAKDQQQYLLPSFCDACKVLVHQNGAEALRKIEMYGLEPLFFRLKPQN